MKAVLVSCLLLFGSFPLSAQDSAGMSATSAETGSRYSFQQVTIQYKKTPWHLIVLDSPEQKQVLHITKEKLDRIAAIVANRDGKTHYLEITNFFEVLADREKAEMDQDFLYKTVSAIQQKRFYQNNSVFMLSSTTVDGEAVVRFKLPFYNETSVGKLTKARYDLREDYYQTSPAAFLKYLTPGQVPILPASGKSATY